MKTTQRNTTLMTLAAALLLAAKRSMQMKIMKHAQAGIAIATAMVMGAGTAHAVSVTVTNPSFESGTTDWAGLGVLNVNEGLSPRPDGSANNAWSNGGVGYQVLGTAVQANTTYTLTVDVGDRSGTGFPVDGTELRLGVGSTSGQNLLLLTGESRPVPTSGWQVWTATFESGPNPVAGNLRVELLGGGVQPQFDNVRLDAVASSFDPTLPWNAFVRNYSFEEPDVANGASFTPYLWSSASTAGVDRNGTGNHDPTPDTADGEQLIFSNGGDAYQLLATVKLETGCTYTLTVDVGDRTDTGFGGAQLRLGTGSTYGNNLLAATVVANTTPVNGGGASDGWQTWVSTFTAGSGVVGDPLRIELVNPGGAQTLWDNVRLSVTPPAGVVWTTPAISAITATSAGATADVTQDLTQTVLVWDTTDKGTTSINDWVGSLSVGATNAGTVNAQATNLSADTLYTVRYYGANASGSAWSDAATFSTALTAAQKPVFTSAVVAAWNRIELAWQDNAAHETGYLLQRSTNGTDFTTIASLAPNTTSYADAPVTLVPTTYTYRLAATNVNNGSATAFEDCLVTAVTTPPDGLIFYDSFENPDVTGLTNTKPTGWSAGAINDENAGLFTTPYGNQAAWLNGGSMDTTAAILSAVLQAGYTYTLSYNVARRSDLGGDYVVSLRAGATTLASQSGTPTKTDFSESGQIVFTPDASHAGLLGQTLVIRLALNTTLQPHFDNIMLLAVPPSGSPYSTWANGFLPADVSNPALNFDGDTLTNLQEFAFGTNPTVSSSAEIVVSGASVTPGTPKIVEAGGTYSIVFGRRADYVAAGLTYTVQFSAGLDTWVDNNDGTNPPVQVATDGTINAMSVPFVDFITTPSGTQKPTFARVKVTMP